MTETSRWVGREITKYVADDRPQVIVEYGAGHGNITRQILERMHPESTLYAFEINPDFCKVLEAIGDPRLKVIQAPAEEVGTHLEGVQVDGIISSIPVTFLSDTDREAMLTQSHSLLKKGTYMMQVLYSTIHLKHFKRYFRECTTKLVFNIPPANVYACLK